LFLNWLGYYLLLHFGHLHYALARPIVAAIVYCGFSYPVWKRVFRRRGVPKGIVR